MASILGKCIGSYQEYQQTFGCDALATRDMSGCSMPSGVVNKKLEALPAVTSTRNQQAPIESSSLFAYFQI
ncbi:hypothetical protein MBANPS3_003209 [Mucor bainieri]